MEERCPDAAWTVRIVAILSCLGAAGCVTPVLIDGDGIRIGLYSVEHRDCGGGARHTKAEGAGLALGRRGVALGYSRIDEVRVPVGEGVNGHFTSPLAEIWVGEDAEREALAALTRVQEGTR